jgi:hypothetical protein
MLFYSLPFTHTHTHTLTQTLISCNLYSTRQRLTSSDFSFCAVMPPSSEKHTLFLSLPLSFLRLKCFNFYSQADIFTPHPLLLPTHATGGGSVGVARKFSNRWFSFHSVACPLQKQSDEPPRKTTTTTTSIFIFFTIARLVQLKTLPSLLSALKVINIFSFR